MKLKKTTLNAVLKHFDLEPSDFGSAVARASDGYAVEISEDMLWQKDVVLVFEADDRRLSLRVYVRRERAMYCVRAVSYTHLDVYKRQVLYSVRFSSFNTRGPEFRPASVSAGRILER